MTSAYLDLLKLVLTGMIFPEPILSPLLPTTWRSRLFLGALALWNKRYSVSIVEPYDEGRRRGGDDWPRIAYTMVGMHRLNNVQALIETVLRDNIPGDLCECGVWRGGCSIFMRAVLKEHNSPRNVWLADSFEGMPVPNAAKYNADLGYDLSKQGYLVATLDSVKANFARFNLLDDQVRFLKGWFSETLPTAPMGALAILRADGDLYESTTEILVNLYDRVSPGGFVIFDDYFSWEPCRKAVHDFRAARGISEPIEKIDAHGVFWRKRMT